MSCRSSRLGTSCTVESSGLRRYVFGGAAPGSAVAGATVDVPGFCLVMVGAAVSVPLAVAVTVNHPSLTASRSSHHTCLHVYSVFVARPRRAPRHRDYFSSGFVVRLSAFQESA